MKTIFTILGVAFASVLMNAQVTIAQVYGGGGNSGATFNRDYVVLFNKTSSAVDMSGWSLQYGSSGSTAAWSGVATFPSGTTIQAYSYFLVGFASQNVAVGAVLPITVDLDTPITGTGNINLAAANGKVALMTNATIINGTTPTGAIDFVGYGTANASEGTPTSAPSATNAILRLNGGCTDTNVNSADFVLGTPSPLNSASATNVCASLGTSDAKSIQTGSFVKNSFVKNNEIVFGADVKDVKVFNMFGQIVKEASVKENGTVNVAELAKGNYIVTGTVNNQPVSQKVLKD
ncbi:lamin tail domain-containing protein [Chryseobacterium aureum]|uniref:lamin tail domain-containing protein n=1 Tax=Chryseobacterium aureum TaxID=2497456 RepID=UPI000F867168|nr:lamin tail domain-containing protein [Chryseobacterium aureum]